MTVIPNKLVLLHNPGAGDEEHGKEQLVSRLQEAGYDVSYQSLKKIGWQGQLRKAEAVVVAGGDGTVRKAVKALLAVRPESMPPVGLLPLGTANNIANSLYGTEDHEVILRSWRSNGTGPFDLGFVKGAKSGSFFIEALGFGVFPVLMQLMKQVDKSFSDQPRLRLDIALGILAGIVRNFKTASYKVTIDGADHSGDYLLAEVINIASFGPNLRLHDAPAFGDGAFDVVLIPESGREQLLDYLGNRLKGDESGAAFPAIRGRNIGISVDAKRVHVDDKLIKERFGDIGIELQAGKLQFMGVGNGTDEPAR